MSANFLLLWMSARGQGSWAQFRAAVEQLHVENGDDVEDEGMSDQFALPLYQTLRLNLQRIGHAEFFTGAGEGAEWRVAPPALAVTRGACGWLGVVAGARTLALMERLREATQAPAKLLKVAYPAYPDQLVVAADDWGALVHIAKKSGLSLQNDAPAAILTSLPPVDDPSVRYAAQRPFGSDWKIERFSSDDLKWHPATHGDSVAASCGLFQFSLGHRREMLFCARGAVFRVPAQVGKYLVLKRRRRHILTYDRPSRLLSFPASCRPPFLIERALILCSGCPPAHESGSGGGTLHYIQIPQNIASIVAALLRQELR